MKPAMALLVSMALAGSPALAQDTPAPTPTPVKPVLFHPPDSALPGVLPLRVGGGSRGASTDGISLITLAPDCVAYTTEAQPTLYWYQSITSKHPCQITITQVADGQGGKPKSKPLIVLKTDDTVPPGMHAVRLSKLKIELQPDVTYSWSVAVVMDPQNRSLDVIANGLIQRKELASDVAGKVSTSSTADKPSIYAANGYWYDALKLLNDQIDQDPKNTALHSQRASLLDQVKLDGEKIDRAS